MPWISWPISFTLMRVDRGGCVGSVRKVVGDFWGMLCADDGGTVLRSPSGVTKVAVTTAGVLAALGLTVLEKKTETMHMPEPHTAARTLRIAGVSQDYSSEQRIYLPRGTVTEHPERTVEIKRRVGLAMNCFKSFQRVTPDQSFGCSRPKCPRRYRVRALRYLRISTTTSSCAPNTTASC